MRFLRTQKGFTGLEIALIVAVVSAVGAAGYFAFEARSNAINPKTEQTPQPAPAKSEVKKDPYEGWTTFTSKINKVSFKYPSDWKNNVQVESEGGYSQEKGVITSPSGFELRFHNPVNGIGSACPMPCSIVNKNYQAEKIPSILGKETWVIKQHTYDTADPQLNAKRIGLWQRYSQDDTFDPRSEQESGPMTIFAVSLGVGYETVMVRGSYPESSPQAKLDLKQYFELPDLKDAELILKSVKIQ